MITSEQQCGHNEKPRPHSDHAPVAQAAPGLPFRKGDTSLSCLAQFTWPFVKLSMLISALWSKTHKREKIPYDVSYPRLVIGTEGRGRSARDTPIMERLTNDLGSVCYNNQQPHSPPSLILSFQLRVWWGLEFPFSSLLSVVKTEVPLLSSILHELCCVPLLIILIPSS